ncbi:beta strand repeat-containing protein [Uliginosibacterium gangwonense]|uniref:beta strand repeat-containing protein n=1 Tax=Uliginosibacterium gangwonense TaxID=392736 RepID=UPI001B7FBC76|nr:fibronectin type III domain-containing protein [Uliginosibacterium gangwonense]
MSFTSSTTGVCTITSGGALTFVTTGTCTINADQAGNGTYLPATTVSRSFSVNAVVPGAPSIGTATAGDTQATVTFTAPAFTGGASITGYTVTSNPGGFTGTGGTSPITVTGLTNGTAYTFTVTATNSAGTGSASAASNSATPRTSQTITFANPGAQNFGTTPTLTATSSSGLTVSFASSTTGVCTITSGGALTFVTIGTCTIDADQVGNGTYLPATTVSRSFTVNAVVPGAPTIGTATAGAGQASVSFTAPAFTGGASITSYTVTSSPGGFTGTGATSPITVTGLNNSTAYTFTVRATNSAGTGPASAASNSVTPMVTQTITFANPGAQNFGTTPTLSATSDSGLTVSFTSSTTGVCTITSGGALTFVTTGTCTINADQAGNGSYLAAATVTRSFTVNAVVPGSPTIGTAATGAAQASVSFSAPAFTGGASITGYTVTSSPGGFTGTGTGSPLVVTGLTNGTSYTFTVTATNSVGTGPASAASNSVVPQAVQTITFANPGSQNFGTTPTLSATASSGLTVSFTSSTTGVCTVTTGGALTFVTIGTCTINADQAGNGSYAAATTVTRSFSVGAVAPGAPSIGTATAGNGQATVSFTAPSATGGASITAYTVTSSPGGLTVTGAASPLTVTGLTNGTAYTFTVTATNSAGVSVASSASNSVTPKATQTITFANPGAQNFGTTPTLTATASSGLAVTFTSSTTGVCTVTAGGTLAFLSTGTCTINADQAGNSVNGAAATVTHSFAVNAVVPGAPTIGTATAGAAQVTVSFTAPSFTGGASITSYTVASSPGGFTATGSSSPITVTGLTNGTAYTFTVTASNSAGTSTASSASNSATPKANQTISFANPGAQNFGTTPTLSATSSSGLSVSFSSGTTGVCTITTGGSLSFLAAGTCTINADQVGNGSYAAASTVSQSFTVAAVLPGAPSIGTASAGNTQATVSFTAPSFTGGSAITSYTVTSSPGNLTATGTASPITVTGLTNSTAYTFTVRATNSAGIGAASGASNSVTPVPGAPVANAVSATVAFGSSANVITPTLGGGTAASMSVAHQPAHGTASVSGLTLIYTPTNTYSGSDSFTYTATNAGGTSAAATVTITVNPQAPGAAAVHMTVETNSTNNVVPLVLTGGVATSAAVVTAPSHGTTAVSGATITYTPTNGYTGNDSFTYTASNAGGTSSAATVSIVIQTWPNPAKDQEVISLVNAQVDTVKRFALTQTTNFQRHLEGLHTRPSRANAETGLAQGNRSKTSRPTQTGSADSPSANLPSSAASTDTNRITMAKLESVLNDTQTANPFVLPTRKTSGALDLPWSSLNLSGKTTDALGKGIDVWTAGVISLGRVGATDSRFTTSGISIGSDKRFSDELVLGAGVGLGHIRQKIGTQGTRDTGNNYSIVLYGSYQPAERFFLDGVFGYGRLNFDSQRYSSAADAMATSSRSGSQWFSSVSGGFEYVNGKLLFSPYIRLDLVSTTLNSTTENDAGLYNLIYSKQHIATNRIAFGLRGETSVYLASVLAKPYFRLEYQHDFEKPGTTDLRYASLPSGQIYQLEMDGSDRNAAVLGFGSSFAFRRNWTLDLRYQLSKGSQATRVQSFGANVRKSFE